MKKIISGLLVLLALLLPAVSRADGREGGAAGVWTVRAENGEVLCTLADEAHVGDEYISGGKRAPRRPDPDEDYCGVRKPAPVGASSDDDKRCAGAN